MAYRYQCGAREVRVGDRLQQGRGRHPPGESHSQMEGFQGEDRHDPLPHIALSTTALKSVYRNTASLSTHTATELRELLILGDREWYSLGCSSLSLDAVRLREVCYRATAVAVEAR